MADMAAWVVLEESVQNRKERMRAVLLRGAHVNESVKPSSRMK